MSPSFLVIKEYKIKNSKFKAQNLKHKIKKIYHMDCYRIKDLKELKLLGIEEMLQDKESLVLIEWADKISSALPADILPIYFNHDKNNRRIIKFGS